MRIYVALMRSYWTGIMTADGVTGSSNAAAMACLGSKLPSDGPDPDLVDPPNCREHAMAILGVQQKFQHDLDNTPAPARFAADDRAIRSALPQAIADLSSLINVTSTTDKQAVVDATLKYIGDMVPAVTSALDDIDPSVLHN